MRPLTLATAAALAATVLGGCAGMYAGGDLGREREDTRLDRPGRLYALYLGGHSALNAGRSEEAAPMLAAAAAGAPGDPRIAERAFIAALLAGDVTRAAALAPAPEAANAANQRLGRLVRAVEHLAEGRGREAANELGAEMVGYPHRTAAALVRPWALAQAGDLAAATLSPEAPRDRLLLVFGRRDRALMLERGRRHEEAEAAWKALREQAPASGLIALGYGEFLERRGRREEAAELYRAHLRREQDEREIIAALERATARRAAPALPSPAEGAAASLVAPAAALTAERQTELALAYLRLALRLDPRQDRAWLLTGDLLLAEKDASGARAAYRRVRPGSDGWAEAQARLAASFEAEGNTAEALRLVEAAARAAPGDRTLQLAYADVLRAAERWDESAAVLTGLIDRVEGEPDWRLLYLRGVAHDRGGRWAEAEADLQRARKLNPDDPELLNYLAYGWIDRGQRLTEALGMIEQAVARRPRSGALVDTLGWAHYRLGNLTEAVKHLERAVELEPADPVINDHLGDAYWRAGRRTEAQFQWRRVLTLDPDAKVRADAERKLASGMEAGSQPARAAAP